MAKYNRIEDNFTGILRNLNGSEYAVAEKLSEQDLLLINIKSGEAVLAHGVKTFERVNDDGTSDVGIEWSSGDYASSITSYDMKKLRREYGKDEVFEMNSFKLEVTYDKEQGLVCIESDDGLVYEECEVEGDFVDIGSAITNSLLAFEKEKTSYTVEIGLRNPIDEKHKYDYQLFSSNEEKEKYLNGEDAIDWREKPVKFNSEEQILLSVQEHVRTSQCEKTSIIYENDSREARIFKGEITDPNDPSMDYIATIERSKNQNLGGYDTSKDRIRFGSYEDLVNFLQGQPSYNWLDDSVSPLKDYETVVKVITVSKDVKNLEGELLFDRKNGINELIDPKTGDKIIPFAKETPSKDVTAQKSSPAKEEKAKTQKNKEMEH